MDFDFDGDLQLFQRETRAWVDREAPKAWARELENIATLHPDALYLELGPGAVLKGLAEEVAMGTALVATTARRPTATARVDRVFKRVPASMGLPSSGRLMAAQSDPHNSELEEFVLDAQPACTAARGAILRQAEGVPDAA